ncbi:DUF262 domain-containing protein [Salinirubellus salinus]|uniref:DUF262 domain-containing protein n=1 Tax=Salinirubellus salinus TaxID=1364945 RepID=A0A9E7R5W0_9EURY|nr:DUF262 domain-containing protein [Salinirubellus salinus]UWM55903.1 DUF262 domain-containing protein [Salinirubellus salinus]
MRDSIASYLSELNDATFLPGLQREFVWSPAQIEGLFDSLIRDYPVGLVITWNIRRTERDHVAYEFIRDYVAGDGAVPDAVYDAGFQRYNEPADAGRFDTLVIDGQQRLNSVLVGLTGSIAQYVGGRGRSRSDVANWERQVLCVDLFGHPDYDEPSLAGDYTFRFRRAEGFGKTDRFGYDDEDGTHRFWHPLSAVVDENGRIGSVRSLRRDVRATVEDASVDADEATREELRDVAVGVVNDVVDRVLEHPLPSHEVSHETEHIREIFQRINTQGSDPKPYQLLLSNLMSYWPYLEESAGPLNPRARIEEWIERFQREYPGFQRQTTRRLFVRYSCYLLGRDLGGVRSVGEFERADFDRLHALWRAEGDDDDPYGTFVGSLDRAFQTLTQVGLTGETVDSGAYVALLAKFYYEQDGVVDAPNRNAVFHLFARLLLLRDSHGTLRRTKAREMLAALERTDESFDTFPGEWLFESLNVQPAPEDVRRAVSEARGAGAGEEFADADVAAVLGLLDEAYADGDVGEMVVDRVYPRSMAPADGVDRLGNLQLVEAETAAARTEPAPDEWLGTLTDNERVRIEAGNHYPEVTPEPDAFEAFVKAREEAIVGHLVDELVLGDAAATE